MYKDKDRQREANAERQRRYKAKQKALPKQGVTEPIANALKDIPLRVYPIGVSKRGLDIKCFEDLPADVQQTIDRMSVVDGKIDQTIKVNRTAIAVHYQHLFPDRYYSTGVA